MTDPLQCLRVTSIITGFYNLLYCLAQFGVLGWQVQVVKNRQNEYENRQIPAYSAIDGFEARFPGLYALYEETPERRRVNAMYAIVLISLFSCIVHFIFTFPMIYGAYIRRSTFIFPWLFTGFFTIIMCTAYADVFNEQLVMSVSEFVASLAINGPLYIIVVFYFIRLNGGLTSNKPRHRHHRSEKHQDVYYISNKREGRSRSDNPRDSRHRRSRSRSEERRPKLSEIPPWRTEWPNEVPKPVERHLAEFEQQERKRQIEKLKRKMQWQKDIDINAPEVRDQEFPWKTKGNYEMLRRHRSPGSAIRELYYEDFPSERSFHRPKSRRVPRGAYLANNNEKPAVRPSVTSERVTFSRQEPQVYYRTPDETVSSHDHSADKSRAIQTEV